jgi:ADP-ribosylarginine hydrolase
MPNIKEKISASLVLGSYLDTLGYFNGIWEFNYNTNITNPQSALVMNYEIVHNFFALGGYNININGWFASDDTIMMIATMKACKKGGSQKDFITEYLKILPLLEEQKRTSGISTLQSLRILKRTGDPSKIHYSSSMGGNGAAMRTHYIGIHFNDINKIIEVSISASRLTHNYPLGFLGGMTTALFTHYAINNVHPWEWTNNMLELEDSGVIDKIVKKQLTNNEYNNYIKDKDEFWISWRRFQEIRVSKFTVKTKEFMFAYDRFNELFKVIYNTTMDKNDNKIPYERMGASGNAATIFALDSLLASINPTEGIDEIDLDKPKDLIYNWQSLVFFSTLHFGDNDTIGTIAGIWFGALRGYEGVNKNIINMLEFKNELS